MDPRWPANSISSGIAMCRASICLTIFLAIVALLSSAEARAEKRVALVIGNSAYSRVPKLANPGNDAAAMAMMLKSAGFDEVVRVADLGITAMRRSLREFSDLAHDADIAVVFYAGHGIEVAGVNYLIPIDAVLERDIDVQDEAIALERLSQILEPVRRLRLIILDACRDNPFARSMRRTIATRSVRSGYGEIDERALPPNTLVAYSQRAGATADDGTGRNSPYTSALLNHLPVPGVDIELALRRVRDEVLKATRNRQEPFKYGSLSGNELPLVAKAAGDTPAPSASASTGGEAEAASSREWRGVDKSSKAELETFLARHAASAEAAYARARLEDIRRAEAREAQVREAEQHAKEAEARRLAQDAEARRLAGETEARRLAALEAIERKLALEAEARRREEQREAAAASPPEPPRRSVTPSTSLTAFRIKAGVSQGIHNMRSGPGTGHSLVASIPAGSSGVQVDLESCRDPDDGRSSNEWCRATWQGRSGWVSMGGLTR
jgi:uncharacterized caspase-like protein